MVARRARKSFTERVGDLCLYLLCVDMVEFGVLASDNDWRIMSEIHIPNPPTANDEFIIEGTGFDPTFGNVNFTMQDPTAIYFWAASCGTRGGVTTKFWTEQEGEYIVTAWQNRKRHQVNSCSTSFEVT